MIKIKNVFLHPSSLEMSAFYLFGSANFDSLDLKC